MNNEPTESTFDERDIEDDIMNDLPTGGEKLPMTNEDQESYDAFKEFFYNAWIH